MAIVMAGPDLAVQLTNRDGPKARYGGAVSARFDSVSVGSDGARRQALLSTRRDARGRLGLNRLLEIGVMHFARSGGRRASGRSLARESDAAAPFVLGLKSAASAQAARRSNVRPSRGANAMPTVAPMRTSRPSITKGVPSARDSVRKYARLVFAVDSSLQHDKFVAARYRRPARRKRATTSRYL